jgi:hypothetical protein
MVAGILAACEKRIEQLTNPKATIGFWGKACHFPNLDHFLCYLRQRKFSIYTIPKHFFTGKGNSRNV